MGETDLGVVIVSYNTRDLLSRCLSSLAKTLPESRLAAEVWVVDNASADGSVDLVRQRYPAVTVVALEDNLGYAAACNVGLARFRDSAKAAAPPWTLVLNADTELRPGALDALVGALAENPRAAVAGPKLLYPDGRLQHSAFRFPGIAQTVLDLFPMARLQDHTVNGRYPVAAYAAGAPFEVDFPLGACLLVRTEAMQRVGLMDDRYFMYCEEIDWCRRFADAGYGALCVPAAEVVHVAGASTSQHRPEMLAALWRSRLRYFRTHEGRVRAAVLASIVRLGFAARRWLDRVAVLRGRMHEPERAARAHAYRAALAPRVEGRSEDGP